MGSEHPSWELSSLPYRILQRLPDIKITRVHLSHMPAAFSGLRATPEASTASLPALRTDPILFCPPLEALGFHQGPCCQDMRNKSMFPNVPLYPGPSGSLWAMCAVPKVLNQEGRKNRKPMIGEGAPLR